MAGAPKKEITRCKTLYLNMTAAQKESLIMEAEYRHRGMSQLFRLIVFGVETDGIPEPCVPRPIPVVGEFKTHYLIPRMYLRDMEKLQKAALDRDLKLGPMCVAILFGSDPRRVVEHITPRRERAVEEAEKFYEEPPERSPIREPMEKEV